MRIMGWLIVLIDDLNFIKLFLVKILFLIIKLSFNFKNRFFKVSFNKSQLKISLPLNLYNT